MSPSDATNGPLSGVGNNSFMGPITGTPMTVEHFKLCLVVEFHTCLIFNNSSIILLLFFSVIMVRSIAQFVGRESYYE